MFNNIFADFSTSSLMKMSIHECGSLQFGVKLLMPDQALVLPNLEGLKESLFKPPLGWRRWSLLRCFVDCS